MRRGVTSHVLKTVYFFAALSLIVLLFVDLFPLTAWASINTRYIDYQVPAIDTSFKAFMDYRTITDESSAQYALQQQAYTDEYGFRRIDDYFLIAMGTYYTEECGVKFRITLDSGKQFNVIVADIKSPAHTDDNNMYHPVNEEMGNVIEFIVDTDVLDDLAILLGNVSCLGFEGNVINIAKVVDY